MTSMRERMARALYRLGPCCPDETPWIDDDLYEAVDAILAEMDTPSEEAIEIAYEAASSDDQWDIQDADDYRRAHRAMIRAIRDGK